MPLVPPKKFSGWPGVQVAEEDLDPTSVNIHWGNPSDYPGDIRTFTGYYSHHDRPGWTHHIVQPPSTPWTPTFANYQDPYEDPTGNFKDEL